MEPCPFVPLSVENVRNGGLRAAFESPFLAAIRRHPWLLQGQKYACALFENKAAVTKLATSYQ
ncbi:MAG: hypothetical protein ACUVX8_05585 [Candidatus Zipacnadales bacterium]